MIFAAIKHAPPVNLIRKKSYYSMRPEGDLPSRLAGHSCGFLVTLNRYLHSAFRVGLSQSQCFFLQRTLQARDERLVSLFSGPNACARPRHGLLLVALGVLQIL